MRSNAKALIAFSLGLSFLALPLHFAQARWCAPIGAIPTKDNIKDAGSAACDKGYIETAPLLTGATNSIQSELDLGVESPIVVVMKVMNWVLGLLGLVAVILIILGGFKWMTAAGSEENIKKAKKVLIAGVVGLVIILVGLGVANFVINQLKSITTEPAPVTNLGGGQASQ